MPVIPNGGRRDFRDPKVIWDAERQRWVALIAEGQRIGFWTSSNLRDWVRVSEYVNTGLGVLECPDLFQIRADDGTLHWVMGLSGNGYLTGAPSTYAYWTGSFDGTTFVPDAPDPQWLDHGFDWYGAVTWADPADSQQDRRLAVGWMNSWSYPYTTPTWAADGFNGTDSIVREIRLARFGAEYSLVSQPVAALDDLATSVADLGTFRVDGHLPLDHHGDAYQLEADISWDDLDNVGLQLRRSADGTRHADVGIFGDVSYLNRGGTGNPDPSGEKWESHAPFDPTADRVHLRILVDRTTVEVFVDDGSVCPLRARCSPTPTTPGSRCTPQAAPPRSRMSPSPSSRASSSGPPACWPTSRGFLGYGMGRDRQLRRRRPDRLEPSPARSAARCWTPSWAPATPRPARSPRRRSRSTVGT